MDVHVVREALSMGKAAVASRHPAIGRPAVSVVLYVHDGEASLHRSIDSILTQTMPDFELCILDDGSTDGTADIIRSYRDPRIRSQWQPAEGPARLHETFNRVLGMARSELVAIANSDDIWRPEKLTRQLEAFDADPELDVCYHDVSFMDAEGRITYGGYRTNRPWPETTLDRADFLSGDPIPNPTVMFRQDIIRVIGLQEVGWVHDFQFWAKAAFGGCRFLGLPDRLAMYRRGEGTSTAHGNEAAIRDASLAVIADMSHRHALADIFPDLAVCDDGPASIAYAHLDLANRFILNGQDALAREELEAVLRLQPGNAAALNNLAICLGRLGDAAGCNALFRRAADAGSADAVRNARTLQAARGRPALKVADWVGPLPALGRLRGTGPRPGRPHAPAAATLVALACDADLGPAIEVMQDIAAGRSLPRPVLFVTESGATTAALSDAYDQAGIPDPEPGRPPAIEALQVIPGNHRSVVAAHLLTAVRVIVAPGGPRAMALREAFPEACGDRVPAAT
jgi:glycosyltransferase involved in cell wall biosynthesis